MLSLLAFLVAIAVLIAVHEWGHYAAARACGVRVLRFSIGFGPRLLGWTSRASGTEFVVGAVPLGGYVKMLDEREGAVAPEDRPYAFNVQSVRVRAAIVAAGPLSNLLLAVALYAGLNWTGVEQAQAVLSTPVADSVAAQAGLQGGERVLGAAFEGDALTEVRSFADLRWWLTRAALNHEKLQLEYLPAGANNLAQQSTRVVVLALDDLDVREADDNLHRTIGILGPFVPPVISQVVPGGAAAQAGVLADDRVLQVDGQSVLDAAQLRERIRAVGESGSPTTQVWLVQRSDTSLSLELTPRMEGEGAQAVPRVGVSIGAKPSTVVVRYGPWEGLERALLRTWEVSTLTLQVMGRMVVGEASLKNISGPITIADYAGKFASVGLTPFLLFLALISISLGVLNLLPVPVLDGGHLMYYLWEFLTGKAVSELWMERLQKLGMAVLLVLMSIAIFNDVARLAGA